MTQLVNAGSSGRAYKLIRVLGRGAMGEVWLAEDTVLGRQVALKFLTIQPGLGEEERKEAVARFTREAQAAGRLSHPNIVTVYDFGEMEDRYFISMEYLEGETLDKVIARGALPFPSAASLVTQLAEALAYAHSQGVVHRDVKPENIFVLPDGRLKVTDFGIARLATTSTVTHVGTVIGTPGYMSPEQVRGEKVDERSDIFSCGVILFELLTGRRAFQAESITSIMYRVVHQPLPPLPSLRSDLPPGLAGWLSWPAPRTPRLATSMLGRWRRTCAPAGFPRLSRPPRFPLPL